MIVVGDFVRLVNNRTKAEKIRIKKVILKIGMFFKHLGFKSDCKTLGKFLHIFIV